MYAVIQTGGKQYKVTEGTTFAVEKLAGDVGTKVTFDQVLFVGGNGTIRIGTPLVSGVKVEAKIVAAGRAKKVIVFKRTKRKGFHKMIGHRQPCTEVEILKINA